VCLRVTIFFFCLKTVLNVSPVKSMSIDFCIIMRCFLFHVIAMIISRHFVLGFLHFSLFSARNPWKWTFGFAVWTSQLSALLASQRRHMDGLTDDCTFTKSLVLWWLHSKVAACLFLSPIRSLPGSLMLLVCAISRRSLQQVHYLAIPSFQRCAILVAS